MKFEINNKMLIAIAMLSASFSFGDFISIMDSDSDNGVDVIDKRTIDTTPVGTVMMWTTSTPPTGWIEMNGQSTGSYPDLASIVGSNVPDVRGQFMRAWDNGKSVDPNRNIGTFQAQDFKGIYLSNNQAYSDYTHTSQYFKNIGSPESGTQGLPTFGGGWSAPAGGIKLGFGNEEVRPTNYSIMYIIKATKED